MKIAVIGNGEGSGKTFIATNLAGCCNWGYCDGNFNNPNAFTFFEEEKSEGLSLVVSVPNLSGCKNLAPLAEKCNKNAFYSDESGNFFYNELVCKDCGSCILTNENGAEVVAKEIANLTLYSKEKIKVGYAKEINSDYSNLVLNGLIEKIGATNLYIDTHGETDALTYHAVKNADYCLIVCEPSNDNFEKFKGAVRTAKLFSKPYGVVFNKQIIENRTYGDYCYQQNATILGSVPYFGKREEKLISNGKVLSLLKPVYKQIFTSIHQQIKKK